MGTAVFRVLDCAVREGRSAPATSVKLFHFPHSGQRPSHFGSWWPHPEHSNRARDFVMRNSPRPKIGASIWLSTMRDLRITSLGKALADLVRGPGHVHADYFCKVTGHNSSIGRKTNG